MGDSDQGEYPCIPGLRGRSVLLLSDDSGYCERLVRWMGAADLQAVSVTAGMVMRAQLEERSEQGQPVDVVLIDVEIPEGAGWAEAEWLQRHPDYAEAVIMLCRPGERLESAAGRQDMPYCVEKQASFTALAGVICGALGLPLPASPGTRKVFGRHARSLTVLVAEDNPLNQKLAQRVLEKMGHKAVFAETGRQALACWQSGGIDAILMDVDMPEMDGYEATSKIRAREHGSGRHIPIMAMTAHVMPDVREACLAAGMDGFLPKPINLGELELYLAGVAGCGQRSGYVDAAKNPALFAEMAEIFIRDYPAYLSEVRIGLSAGDMEKVRRSAHALKGMCMVFSANVASDTAWEVERATDIDACSRATDRLEQELEAFRKSLQARLTEARS